MQTLGHSRELLMINNYNSSQNQDTFPSQTFNILL